jgi:hypothetical protein
MKMSFLNVIYHQDLFHNNLLLSHQLVLIMMMMYYYLLTMNYVKDKTIVYDKYNGLPRISEFSRRLCVHFLGYTDIGGDT